MQTWELDFYRCSLVGADGQPLWELLVCTAEGRQLLNETCPAAEASASWVGAQLQTLFAQQDGPPLEARAFRAATFNLAAPVFRELGVPFSRSRRAIAVARWRSEREEIYPSLAGYRALQPGIPLQRAVPAPIPEEVLPERWGFSAMPAADLPELQQLPIEYLEAPVLEGLSAPVPGVFLFSSRGRSLARWLALQVPVSLQFTQAELDGLVLEAGLDERWIVATFEDADMRERGRQFNQRLLAGSGLHFLAVQPAEGSPTIHGFWLLQTPLG